MILVSGSAVKGAFGVAARFAALTFDRRPGDQELAGQRGVRDVWSRRPTCIASRTSAGSSRSSPFDDTRQEVRTPLGPATGTPEVRTPLGRRRVRPLVRRLGNRGARYRSLVHYR